MNCKRAKSLIALCVGGDLDKANTQLMRQHVDQCPACREYGDNLRESLSVLQELNVVERSPDESCWPRVAAQLRQQRPAVIADPWSPTRFLVPLLGVAAAAIVVVSFVIAPGSDPTGIGPSASAEDSDWIDESWKILESTDDISGPIPYNSRYQRNNSRYQQNVRDRRL